MTLSLDDFEGIWGTFERLVHASGNQRLIAMVQHEATRKQLRVIARNAVEKERSRRAISQKRSRPGPADPTRGQLPPELWTKRKREKANVAAMQLLARHGKDHRYTAGQRATLATYSGWGGLSIRDNKDEFPKGLVPEVRGLIHEYYTPTKVVREVARVVAPLIPSLPHFNGKVRTLEPSAGIGRFVQAFSGVPNLDWSIIEYSHISALLLQAIRQDLNVWEGPFEQWVTENHQDYDQTFGLVLSNPPYGERGDSTVLDPVRAYRQKQAYEYFMLRTMDLLAPGGLGVFLVPGGFLTKRSTKLRERVLSKHHLSAAFRLPSKLFPGAMLVIDLIFMRSRGKTLKAPLKKDQFIVDGEYFEQYPDNILGEEVGKDGGEDNQGPTAKPRWGYQVKGEFEKLPNLFERRFSFEVKGKAKASGQKIKGGGRVDRDLIAAAHAATETQAAASALSLGARVDAYFAAVAKQDEGGVGGWNELRDDLLSWVRANGNPARHAEVQKLVRTNNDAAVRFVQAFKADGSLVSSLEAPAQVTSSYNGRADDLGGILHWAYRQETGGIRITELASLVSRAGGLHRMRASGIVTAQLPGLVRTGAWCVDGDALDRIVASADYYSGDLWPKYDRVKRVVDNPGGFRHIEDGKLHGIIPATVLGEQAQGLRAKISPVVGEDIIQGLTPQQAWIPVHLVSEWASQHGRYSKTEVQFYVGENDGLLYAKGPGANVWDPFLGWYNHYDAQFKVSKSRETPLMVARDRVRKEWTQSFQTWLATNPTAVQEISDAYNRKFRGYVAPQYGQTPPNIARWKGPITLKPHQAAGARRVLHNRLGLVAFDVGVGKTFTGIAIMAKAREEGWARRPVILVPNTLVMNWKNQIKVALPDYRVGIIGSNEVPSRKKGPDGLPLIVVRKDTPEQRAAKWLRFQAGDFDCMILPYSMLNRTRLNREALEVYAAQSSAIQREIEIAKRKKKKSERDLAIIEEQGLRWIAEKAEISESMRYDPGIAWDDLGVDMLIVDEAQNFKNLYMAESRDGSSPPKFMGAGQSSKRAWQLDFRCASVRALTGGSGVVLLSATPAKNSPLEFYNLIQYVRSDAWAEVGIPNPEQFIDRYLKIEQKRDLMTNMKFAVVPAVTGFQNIPELRDILFRYAEFKTAEDVGIIMPKVTANLLHVKMDGRQDKIYDELVFEYNNLKGAGRFNKEAAARKLQIMSELSLVALHPEIPGMNWKNADQVENKNCPKFREVARRVLAQMDCGHVVFVENTAVHAWLRDVLVEAGVPKKRIAIMNAIVAKSSARQRIADGFNGKPTNEYDSHGNPIRKPPEFDVVIANSVAYEGIDLQVRTCAIHHLDLPWEPATLQQRNGRGVRQGNTLENISINYYMSRRSMDGRRFAAINGKHGWMKTLLTSQDRDTNNPGAQAELSEEEIALMISRNPTAERAEMKKVRRANTVTMRLKMATAAGQILRSVKGRLDIASRARTADRAEQMRAEAAVRRRDLALVDPVAWPYLDLVDTALEKHAPISAEGIPLIEGSFIELPSGAHEIGAAIGMEIGLRPVGQRTWRRHTIAELSQAIQNAGTQAVEILNNMDPPVEIEEGEDVDEGPDVIVKTGHDTSGGSDEADEAEVPEEIPQFMPKIFQRVSEDVRPAIASYGTWNTAHLMSSSWKQELFDLDPTGYLAQLSKPAFHEKTQKLVPFMVEGRLVIDTYPGRVTPLWRRRSRNLMSPTRRGLRAFKAAFMKSNAKRISRDDATNAARHWFQNEQIKLPSGVRDNPDDAAPVKEVGIDMHGLKLAITDLGHTANTNLFRIHGLLPKEWQDVTETSDIREAIKTMPGWEIHKGSYAATEKVLSPFRPPPPPPREPAPWKRPKPSDEPRGGIIPGPMGDAARKSVRHHEGKPKKLPTPDANGNKWGVEIRAVLVSVGDTVRVTTSRGKSWTARITKIRKSGPRWLVESVKS